MASPLSPSWSDGKFEESAAECGSGDGEGNRVESGWGDNDEVRELREVSESPKLLSDPSRSSAAKTT
jgi:hypothetical protein